MAMNWTYHEYYQTACWTILAHIGLWAIYFKHTKIGFYTHAVCFTICALMSLATVTPLLLSFAVSFQNTKDDHVQALHNVGGILVYTLSILALFDGIGTKINQIFNDAVH